MSTKQREAFFRHLYKDKDKDKDKDKEQQQ